MGVLECDQNGTWLNPPECLKEVKSTVPPTKIVTIQDSQPETETITSTANTGIEPTTTKLITDIETITTESITDPVTTATKPITDIETITTKSITTTTGVYTCSKNPCAPGICKNKKGTEYVCQCPKIYHSAKTYPGKCVTCSLGEYFSGRMCRKCPRNTYSNVRNLARCLNCPKFYSNHMTGSTSVNDCKLTVPCKPGHYITALGRCKMCHDGNYQTHGYHSNCVKCGEEGGYTTGGPGATYHGQCTLNETTELYPFQIELGLPYDLSYQDSNSAKYLELTHRIESTLNNAMDAVRFFREFRVEKLSEGSVVASMIVTLIKHRYAEDFFKAAFTSLDLESLFPWSATSYYNKTHPEFQIYTIEPRKGPKAGGTIIALKGSFLDLHDIFEIYIGELECKMRTLNNTEATCLTAALEDESLLNIHQKIKIMWPNMNKNPLDLEFTYIYRPDPLIHSIQPAATIINGGILITVFGTNIDSISEPVMEVTAVSPNGRNQYFQPCKVMSDTHFVCLAPDFRNKAVQHSPQNDKKLFQKPQCSWTLQIEDRFDDTELAFFEENIRDMEVSIDFILDNVAKPDQRRFPLSIYGEPVIDVDPHRVDDYVSIWPCRHDKITITGKNLVMINTLWPDSYNIKIGNEECTNIEIKENEITCLPPKHEPLDAFSDNPRVRMSLACQTVINVYDLRYSKNPFDCPAMLIGIGLCLGVLAVILIAAIICYNLGKQWKQKFITRRKFKPNNSVEMQQSYPKESTLANEKIKWKYPTMPREESPVRLERTNHIDENHYSHRIQMSECDTQISHITAWQSPSSKQAKRGTGAQHESRKMRRHEVSHLNANQYPFDFAQGRSPRVTRKGRHCNQEKSMTTFSDAIESENALV